RRKTLKSALRPSRLAAILFFGRKGRRALFPVAIYSESKRKKPFLFARRCPPIAPISTEQAPTPPAVQLLSTSPRKLLLTSLCVGAVAFLVISFRLGQPSFMVFDEPSYIAIARGILHHDLAPLQAESPLGRQHPPLGSLLVAMGMNLAGDNPPGWRLASDLAG